MKTVSIVLFAGMVGAFVQPVSAVEAGTFKEKVLWSFGSGTDGQSPAAGLIAVNGIFFGTTAGGGIYGDGTAFALDPSTGAETVLYSFCIRGEYCLDGDQPHASLIDVKSKLYGTTDYGGGTADDGTVFSLDPSTGKEKVLYSFCKEQNCTDGRNPVASLIDAKGILYGTTDSGGTGSQGFYGTAFALDPKAGTETVLYSFCSQPHCTDGKNPAFALIDVNGTLYGTTGAGGADYTGCENAGCGTVFSLNASTGVETVLHSFVGGSTDGWAPAGSLTNVNGTLYGTTFWGGGTGCNAGTGCGIVFSLDPSTGAETVLHFFCSQQNCADGAEPSGSLIVLNGTLYGTTQAGGSTGCGGTGCGTVFSIDPTTGAETVLYSFLGGTDGAVPLASLIAVNGKLLGTTVAGGAYGHGTVFEIEKKR